MMISPLRALQVEYADRVANAPPAACLAADRPGAATGRRAAAPVDFIPYALPASGSPAVSGLACELVGSFGEFQAEYAAIRRGAGIFDSPHRGTIVVTGSATDRREFLNRMVTQELKDLAPGLVKEAFWLNRTGRIDADLMLIEIGDRMLIDVDIHKVAHTVATLSEFIFSEDVQFADASDQCHHIAVHGRQAWEVIASAVDSHALAGLIAVESLRAMPVKIGGVEVVLARRDQTGEVGLELLMPRDGAEVVWQRLVDADAIDGAGLRRVRPIGWYAFNTARIEAGTPLFNIDFGTSSLPHETGILRQRVSFTKGCYLGQEVVARMESRGHSKSQLAGLRMVGDQLPLAGAAVLDVTRASSDGPQGDSPAPSASEPVADQRVGEQIGVVTSSTLSPMLGAAPIAFAMIRAAKAQIGASVTVTAEAGCVAATIAPLQFWSRAADAEQSQPPTRAGADRSV